MSSRPRRLSALLLPLTIAGLFFACAAHGQLAHEGAAKAIALSQTLPPFCLPPFCLPGLARTTIRRLLASVCLFFCEDLG